MLFPDPKQPRKEFFEKDMKKLQTSIKDRGIMTPIVVEKMKDGKYLIVDGERRYRSATFLGMKEVPINIITEDLDEVDRNIVRFQLQETHSQWTVMEKAQAILLLKQALDLTTKDLSIAIGIPEATVSQYLMLLDFSPRVKSLLIEMNMRMSYILALSSMHRVFPVEISKKYPNYVELAIDKFKNGYIKAYKDYIDIRRLIIAGEYKSVEKWLTNKTYTSDQAMNDSTFNLSVRIEKGMKKAKSLTRELIVIRKNKLEISEIDTLILKQLKDEINQLV
jgi:ParB/RepB/Spo0J family partition protein